ncbi:MAG TPA: hypothetical protein VJ895_01465 [Candidatus Nanoarchaeia archaeon]|nr:hypothetical protein [Candidatus Nanoarchaeia archaeon]
MKKEQKMNTKNLLVSLCTFVFALFLIGSASASLVDDYRVTVDGIQVDTNLSGTPYNVSVVAGEDITVKVYFTADNSDTDVTVEAEIEGDKVDYKASTSVFDVIAKKAYKKTLSLKVPYELKDEVYNDGLELNIEIDGKDYKTVLETITLTVQRPSYNAVIKSVTTPSSIDAGETFPVEIVITNLGYNELDDVYVSAKIAELGLVQGPKWIGDLVPVEECAGDCNYEDTVAGRLYLEVPYNAKDGVYDLEIIVTNDDTKTVKVKEIVINNELSSNIIPSITGQIVAKNEEAVYDLLIVNPTNKVRVYKIVSEGDVSFTSKVVAIPAGSSKVVSISASSEEDGKYPFTANVFVGDSLEESVELELTVEGKSSNSVVVLAIVLAIIFLVLLVVLIVLLGKKPEKTEDFGESYY